MMMKYTFSLLFVSLTLGAFAQQNPADTVPPEGFQRQAFIYSMAKKYNDPDMAKSAIYNILSYNPRNVTLLDSLALLYFEYQQYASAALVSQDIVKINPKDMLANEIAALSFDNLGVKSKALPFYETLWLKDNNINILYRMAFIQYELNRLNEAITSADILLENEQTGKEAMVFPTGEGQKQQQVSMMAAVYRLKGMIREAQGEPESAKENYQKALEIAPDFELVKTALAEMN
jgi:tetratricopeptide (TPR) repeat protein